MWLNYNLQASQSQKRSAMAKHVMSSSCPKKYDIFISFRGEDIRTTFIGHLRSALSGPNIKAYADDHDLQKGQEIWPSLCQAIQDSHFAIVVFSENYAESKWCLKELVQILHCRKTQGLVVIPVFYQVDPSHIRKCTGTYGEAIAKHKDNQSVQDWKAALTEAANISGWDTRSRDNKNESQLIEKIVLDVSEKLRSPFKLKEVEDFVQIEKHCGEVKLLLSKNQDQLQKNVHVIGIWGMGGIGKTTIAKALFSQLFPQYDAVCFLPNVREESQRMGLTSLCDKLLSKLLKEGHHEYNLAGSEDLTRRLGNKKVLIVLDDVDSFSQLDKLYQPCKYVGPGSKLIITTRDRHLLRRRVDVTHVYEVKTWSIAESLELFSVHAFNERRPKKGYEDLSNRAVNCARGVPLALEVLGSNLYSRTTEFWDDELNKLENYRNDNIQDVLQVSYDGLDDLEKEIFLDIAFFFKGEHKKDVVRILDACDFYPTRGLKVLEDKALITISHSGMIEMHDLIEEMGLNIVRGESKDPRNRSRLSDIKEVSDVLANKKIIRKISRNVHHSGVPSKLSGKLRYLEWNGFHLKSLPVTFCAKMLVEIRMPHSHVTELWQGVQDVANLVRIDLSECKHLKNLPDLSKASKLKWVNLSGCESLCDIHPSLFSFDTLETLMLDGCKKLKGLKSEKHLTSLRKISVDGCTSLKEFSLSSDSITSLDLSSTRIGMLDSTFERLTSLESLSVHGLRYGNIPDEIFSLKNLRELKICNSRVAIDKEKLHVLFDGSRYLRLLHLKDCCNLCELPDNIGGLSKLNELRLDGSCVKTLPASIEHLRKLKTLSLENCRELGSLPKLPPFITEFNAANCWSLTTVSSLNSSALGLKGKGKFISFKNCGWLDEPSLHCIMEGALELTELASCQNEIVKIVDEANTKNCNNKSVKVCFPGSKVPSQFKHRTTDSSITIGLPCYRNGRVGLTLCVVLSRSRVAAKIWCQCYLADGTKLEPATTWYHEAVTELNSDHVFIWCDSSLFNSIFESGTPLVFFEFFVTNDKGKRVTIDTPECGVCVMFDSKALMEAEDDNIEIVTITHQCRACLIFEAENFVRISSRSVDAAASGFGLESKATETYDMMGTIAMTNNNHEPDLSEHCSCSWDYLFERTQKFRHRHGHASTTTKTLTSATSIWTQPTNQRSIEGGSLFFRFDRRKKWRGSAGIVMNDSQLIEKIVVDVSEKLSQGTPFKLKVEDFVQIEKHCGEVKLLLSKNQDQLQKNVHVIGIWGMGGIGKTTIAKALFSQLFPQYDAVCFLPNVREESRRIGLTSLRHKLLSDLLKEGHHERRLSNKKVLIVLDDVDSFDQLDELCEPCNYVGPDSKVIITTRNRHLLRGRVDDRHVYEVKTWSFAESLELFSLHAFNERRPKKGYEDLSNRAVNCARGVPLALKVLGSNLYSRSIKFWDGELSKLENYRNDSIQDVLQVSYDGLHDLEKKIFLDIAFFFKGEHKGDVIRILDACDFYATSGIEVLEDKALVTLSNSGMIQMHDLIQEMGLNIVREGSEDPRNRSRLRDIEEVSDVLENKNGSDLIEGIKLDLSSIEDLHLNADTFDRMTNLRILRLYVPSGKRSGNVHHSGVLSKLSSKLRYLEWNGCRLKSLPKSFCGKMLVEICMPHSHVTELWQGVQDLANLVRIDLSECKHLKNVPDLSKASKLKWVNLSGCESLCDIHPSVFSLDTLETLTLDGCKNVKSLKSEKHLKSLKEISVIGCTSLKEFWVSSDSIKGLDLSSTGIEMLDSSIGRLTKLRSLNVEGLRHGNLPNELFSLKCLRELRICNCRLAIDKEKLHVLFDGSRSLRVLHLKDCCNLSELPENIGSRVKTLPATIKHLKRLNTLSLKNCRMLESLPELPPNVLEFIATNCRSLRTVSISTLADFALRTGKGIIVSLQNCSNLLESPSLHCIMEDAHLATKSIVHKNMFLKELFRGTNTRIDNYDSVKHSARQFKYQTTPYSLVIVDLPSSKSDFAGFVKNDLLSLSNIGMLHGRWCEVGTPATTWHHEAVIGLNSDHVFMWHDLNHFSSILKIYDSDERRIFFEFFVTNDKEERVTIRTPECGVYLISESPEEKLTLRSWQLAFITRFKRKGRNRGKWMRNKKEKKYV
ncbi:TMV resistance protein N [Glycine soja]